MSRVLLVAGVERAGTTILANVLDSHPKIRMPSEERILMLGVWLYYGIRNGSKERGKPWYNQVTEINASQEEKERFSEILKDYFITAWREYSCGDYEYIGDKYPLYTPEHFELFNEWFEPIWILSRRNEEDTINSMIKCPWNKNISKEDLVNKYRKQRSFVDSKENDHRCLVVDYENFCNNPDNEVCRISDFLNIEKNFDISNINGLKVS